jgi:hypothetical protein
MIRQKEKIQFINELINIYSFLSYKGAEEIIENMTEYWEIVIKNQK